MAFMSRYKIRQAFIRLMARYHRWVLQQCVLSALAMFVSSTVIADNPLVKDQGVSDPHIRVYGDTVYLYSGHDTSPTDPTWVMKEWQIFSSKNLVDWEKVGSVSPADNYMEDDSTDCWACDAATRNGKYFFYFSDRKRSVGVMMSDRPEGPFVDAIGKPLVAPLHDPTILIDDDAEQTPYLVYGDKSIAYKIARLNEDMISLAEEPKVIEINGQAWEDAPEWMDKNYLFKRNGVYYLTWGQQYATSKNVYGPYRCVGKVGEGYNLSEYAHGSFFEWKGQFYHTWCYYLKKGFKYRETVMTYCHFDNDGKIVDDIAFLDEHFENGVGQYRADWPKIEAEWFYEKTPNINKRSFEVGGFELTGLKDGEWIRFANVEFDTGMSSIEIRATGSGSIDVCLDAADAPAIGTLKFDTGEEARVVSASIEGASGKRDLFLRFKSGDLDEFSIDWLRFTK
jgi:hypothetical protein